MPSKHHSSSKLTAAFPVCLFILIALFSTAIAGDVEPAIPQPAELCPEITTGLVSLLDNQVNIVVAGDKTRKGPLILYWHGTGTDPLDELKTAFDQQAREQLHQAGGIFAAFLDSTGEGKSTSGNGIWHEGDLRLADELVGCAHTQGLIDPNRIHVMGMSAGGLHTTAMGYQRAEYIASVVTLSGGHLVYQGQDGTNAHSSAPDNKFAALIMHGGQEDQYILKFQQTSEKYADTLHKRGHKAMLCNHGQAHTIPAGVSDIAWRFFQGSFFNSSEPLFAEGLANQLSGFCLEHRSDN